MEEIWISPNLYINNTVVNLVPEFGKMRSEAFNNMPRSAYRKVFFIWCTNKNDEAIIPKSYIKLGISPKKEREAP